jgi:argininosuccinate lyase
VLATDVAEALVEAGVPFRTAHAAVGELVKELESKDRTFGDLSPGEWREWQPALDDEAIAQLTPEAAVERRAHGTSSTSVERQLDVLRAALGR